MSELNQNPFEDLAEECGATFVWLVEYCHEEIWWPDRVFEDSAEGEAYFLKELGDRNNRSSAYRLSKIAVIESKTIERKTLPR